MENKPKQGALESAAEEIRAGGCTCIVIRRGEVIHRASGRGVKPLLELYKTEDGREKLAGATVADKIIGKGAAMILHLAGVGRVHGELMSQPAANYLAANGIPYGCGRLVPALKNRAGDGMCPIEQSVLGETDPAKGYENILKTIELLMRGA